MVLYSLWTTEVGCIQENRKQIFLLFIFSYYCCLLQKQLLKTILETVRKSFILKKLQSWNETDFYTPVNILGDLGKIARLSYSV